jgi:DNA invertase Pin-like site-specific DNA recombinase
MIVGYARTSTVEQKAGFEAQIKELEDAKCEKVFKEQVSSVAERVQLQAALDFVREGDVFIVTKIDRLARSITNLMEIIETLQRKQVAVKILNLGMDTQTPTGKLILTLLGGISQFEREIMLERQREGIAKAKAEKKYKGRKPLADEKRAQVLQLADQGTARDRIAEQVGIGVASVYRILAKRPHDMHVHHIDFSLDIPDLHCVIDALQKAGTDQG